MIESLLKTITPVSYVPGCRACFEIRLSGSEYSKLFCDNEAKTVFNVNIRSLMSGGHKILGFRWLFKLLFLDKDLLYLDSELLRNPQYLMHADN